MAGEDQLSPRKLTDLNSGDPGPESKLQLLTSMLGTSCSHAQCSVSS